MSYEMRRQQHRAYWRTETGRDYEVFPTEEEARLFIGLCKKFGRAEIVTRHRARATGAATTMVTTVPAPSGATVAVPALAAGLTAPVPVGITLAWLGEQYVTSGTKTWAGWAKERLTKADNYVVQMHRPLEEPLRSLVIAAALAIDVELKQQGDQTSGSSVWGTRRYH